MHRVVVSMSVVPAAARLRPEVLAHLERTAGPGFPAAVLEDPEAAARYLAAGRAGSVRESPVVEPVASIADERLPSGVGVRTYRPAHDGALPAVVFLHGGGWVLGDLEMQDETCRRLANRVPCVVVSVDYRLAPEHPYPAALDDVSEAVAWVHEQAATLRADPARIVVAGTSAGANLAAAAALRARDGVGPALAGQVLLYPVLDAGMGSPSYEEFADGPVLERRQMAWFWDQYLGATGRRDDPLASPAAAGDLRGLAPALVVSAECDVLRDEAEAYAARLRAAGVPVELRRLEGQVHSFLRHVGVLRSSDEALEEVAAGIGRLVAPPGGDR